MNQPGETAGVVMDGMVGRPDMLASDAEREAATGRLSSAFAEGRLTVGEHAERAKTAYRARTRGELAALTADLPAPAEGSAHGRPAGPMDVHRCLLCALLICCPPAGIARLLAARRRARPRRAFPPESGTAADTPGNDR